MNDQIYKNWRKDVGTDYETTRRLVDEDYTRANISRNTENELVEMNEKLTGATAMNERILKIAQQTDIWCDQNYSGDDHYDQRWELQFAKLIVRECADVVQNAVDHREPASTYVDKIKQHFGVE